MSVHNVKGATPLPDAEMLQSFADVGAFNDELIAAGSFVFAGGLNADVRSSAKVVRPVSGSVVITDGPFAETKESLGGFWIIEADSLSTALEWAAKGAVACRKEVEVRPFHDESVDLAAMMKQARAFDRS